MLPGTALQASRLAGTTWDALALPGELGLEGAGQAGQPCALVLRAFQPVVGRPRQSNEGERWGSGGEGRGVGANGHSDCYS